MGHGLQIRKVSQRLVPILAPKSAENANCLAVWGLETKLKGMEFFKLLLTCPDVAVQFCDLRGSIRVVTEKGIDKAFPFGPISNSFVTKALQIKPIMFSFYLILN